MEQLSLPGVEEHLKKHPLQPHQMSRAQYEADPQTLWRSEPHDILGAGDTDPDEGVYAYQVRATGGDTDGWKASGMHFGDYAAARDRGQEHADSHREFDWADPIRMFSVRAQGRFSNEPVADHPAAEVLPQTKGVAPDVDVGDDPWPGRKTGRWYLNEAEGYGTHLGRGPAETPRVDGGTLSGYVPRKRGFLTTHSEEVLKAHAEGKDVHPAILQQAQIGPEYSETIEPAKPVDRKEGVRTLERPEHPAKLFQTHNPLAGEGEQIDIPTIGGGVIEHRTRQSHAIYVSNEDYDEMLRKHAANRAGESNEPILAHIGEPRPVGWDNDEWPVVERDE